MKLFARAASLIVVAAGISSATVLSQGELKAQKIRVNQAKIEVLRRPKVPFTPFAIVDPVKRKQVTRSEILTIPFEDNRGRPTSKRMTAGEFYDKLNRLEKEFNDLGYSLKTDPDEVLLQKSKLDRASMTRVKRAVELDHKRFDPAKMVAPRTLQQFKSKQLPSLLAMGAGKIASDSTPLYDKKFRYESGDPDLMSAFVRGGLKTEGSKTQAKVTGDFAIGGSMFKKSADILRMTGSMVCPVSGEMNGKVDLLFLGFNIHSYSKSTSAPFTYDSSYDKNFTQKITTIQFSLGPVPMTGEVGILGKYGVRYGISLMPLSAIGFLEPYANIGAYAEVGPGIDVCSSGVGIELIFLEDRVTLTGEATVKDAATAQPYLLLNVNGINTMEMLAGEVYFWVKIPVPKLTPPFWKKKKYKWEVFDWEGIKIQGIVFNETKRVNL